jgi:hypothetical protein
VPRVADAYLDCVAYCYPSQADAEHGKQSGGCGFLLAVPLGAKDLRSEFDAFFVDSSAADIWAGLPHLYAVTNWHVAKDSPFLRLTLRNGGQYIIDGTKLWQQHPDSDLAVLLIPWDYQWPFVKQLSLIPCSNLITEGSMRQIDVGIGDDTFCVGRFINHDGRQQNIPVARFGNIAMMPSRVYITGSRMQTCFLIESRTLPGYSGSPVFLRIPLWELMESSGSRAGLYRFITKTDATKTQGTPALTWLLGIVVGFGTGAKAENTGMMEVIPSWLLLDFLSSAQLIAQRQQEAEERQSWIAAAPAAQSD